MSERRRFSVGMAWMFAGNWVEQACNFAIFVTLARILGAEAFGLAMMAMAFIVFAEFLVRETITEGLIQQHEVEPGHLDATFWLLALLSVV
ncbi:MAG: oligosaccharide flippase family protein, partial [Alphaproteobacteria bacterium]|nr:oligosaccharide flippase family protein [Alphaproteobacteria bacterium]